MLKPNAKTLARRQKFLRTGTGMPASGNCRDALTTNDPYFREALQPNPWRGLKSSGSTERADELVRGGPTVMQIDTRPGLARKSSEHD